MSDVAEGRRPPAATAAATNRGGDDTARPPGLPSGGRNAAVTPVLGDAAAAIAAGPSQPLEQYVVIYLRVHHLKLLLFSIVTIASIGGAAYGYFRLPQLLLPSAARNASFGRDPLGENARFFMFKHDRTGDGVLDVDELEPLAFLLWEAKAIAVDREQPVAAGEELVKVKAYFEPLQLSTISKKLNSTSSTMLTTVADLVQRFGMLGFLPSLLLAGHGLPTSDRLGSLQGLFDWKVPHRETASFGARSLAATFLPPPRSRLGTTDLVLGEPYPLVDVRPGKPEDHAAAEAAAAAKRQRAAAAATATMEAVAATAEDSPDGTGPAESVDALPTSDQAAADRAAAATGGEPVRMHMLSNRYYPPRVDDENEATLHRLLAMFHPRPFLLSRFPPQGSLGCLRAFNDDYAEVVFRIHAEYQLSEPPLYPFWFTPSQFKGSAIIALNSSSVAAFRLYVPNERRLNVDMEWMNSPREQENLEVDIGYVPRMEIVVMPEDAAGFARPPVAPSSFVWTKEVQIDVCERNMEVHFYPFKKVPYFNYTEAFAEARHSGGSKLVHSIVLWGALDDQSC